MTFLKSFIEDVLLSRIFHMINYETNTKWNLEKKVLQYFQKVYYSFGVGTYTPDDNWLTHDFELCWWLINGFTYRYLWFQISTYTASLPELLSEIYSHFLLQWWLLSYCVTEGCFKSNNIKIHVCLLPLMCTYVAVWFIFSWSDPRKKWRSIFHYCGPSTLARPVISSNDNPCVAPSISIHAHAQSLIWWSLIR